MGDPVLGIYEKALPEGGGWPARLAAAAEAGYDFVEISVDDDPERLARLDWPADRRRALRDAAQEAGLRIQTIVLSAHRRHPLGSASTEVRARARSILHRAVDLAGDVGARIVQIAGYFVHGEPRAPRSRGRFLDGLGEGLGRAASSGVMLGIETVDGEDVVSVADAMEIVGAFDSPWLRVYPDVGNLAANGLDVAAELELARGNVVGVHLKDARSGIYRRVPFGAGEVPFVAAFRALDGIGYDGGYLIEMWNDGAPDAAETIRSARSWILERMREARRTG